MSTPKKIRARKLYALTDGTTPALCDYKGEFQFTDRRSEAESKARYNDKTIPVLVLPGSAEAVERMVEMVARALATRQFGKRWVRLFLSDSVTAPGFRDEARCVLSSLGITAGGKGVRK